MLDLTGLLPLVAAAFIMLGGMVKGVFGVGLPMVAVPLLSYILPVPTAIALLAVPVLASNVYQAFRGGRARAAVARFWPLLGLLVVGIVVGVRVLVGLNQTVLQFLLGSVVIGSALFNFFGKVGAISPRLEGWLNPAVGAACGLFGGITSFYGPPLAAYMMALRLDKDTFVSTMAVGYLAGGIPFNLSLAAFDILGWNEAFYSLLACLPVFAGMLLGERLRGVLPQSVFRVLILVILVLIGGSLIAKALAGL